MDKQQLDKKDADNIIEIGEHSSEEEEDDNSLGSNTGGHLRQQQAQLRRQRHSARSPKFGRRNSNAAADDEIDKNSVQTNSSKGNQANIHHLMQGGELDQRQQLLMRSMVDNRAGVSGEDGGGSGTYKKQSPNNGITQQEMFNSEQTRGETAMGGFHSRESILLSQNIKNINQNYQYNYHPNSSFFFSRNSLNKKINQMNVDNQFASSFSERGRGASWNHFNGGGLRSRSESIQEVSRKQREKRLNFFICAILIIALVISIVLALIYVGQVHQPFVPVTSFPHYSTSQQPNQPLEGGIIHEVPLMKELVPDIDTEFHNYLARHNKEYAGNRAEYERRKLNFQANLFMVRRHNKFEYNKTAGYRLEVNFMSDWDADENSGWFYGSLGPVDRGSIRQIESEASVYQTVAVRSFRSEESPTDLARGIDGSDPPLIGRSYSSSLQQMEPYASVDQTRRRQLIGGGNPFSSSSSAPQEAPLKEFDTKNMLTSIDWRDTKGAVSNPKIQGNCGACWAFTASGALEAANFIKSGDKFIPSIQQLIDCTSKEEKGGNFGCEGGFIDYAYEYSVNNALIEDQLYPYREQIGKCMIKYKSFKQQLIKREILRQKQQTNDDQTLSNENLTDQNINQTDQEIKGQNKNGEKKQQNAVKLENQASQSTSNSAVKIKGVKVATHHKITPQDPDQFKAALQHGPVGISINADNFVFRHYSSGILDWITCSPEVAHAVLVIGYGVEGGENDNLSIFADSVPSKGREYFIIKNSWGEEWGEKGYAKIMNSQWSHDAGICGIFTEGYQPVIAESSEQLKVL